MYVPPPSGLALTQVAFQYSPTGLDRLVLTQRSSIHLAVQYSPSVLIRYSPSGLVLTQRSSTHLAVQYSPSELFRTVGTGVIPQMNKLYIDEPPKMKTRELRQIHTHSAYSVGIGRNSRHQVPRYSTIVLVLYILARICAHSDCISCLHLA